MQRAPRDVDVELHIKDTSKPRQCGKRGLVFPRLESCHVGLVHTQHPSELRLSELVLRAIANDTHDYLVGEMSSAAIARLKHDGLRPAVVVETSPGNYQAWLRVAQQPIAPKQATMVARILVERYGGDPASVDWRHFGRLAGFTNRKPKHRQATRMQPFVLVREAAGVATER